MVAGQAESVTSSELHKSKLLLVVDVDIHHTRSCKTARWMIQSINGA